MTKANTLASFLVVLALGIAASTLTTWRVCRAQERQRAEVRDAAIRAAIYVDFGVPETLRPQADKMDLWALLADAGQGYSERAQALQSTLNEWMACNRELYSRYPQQPQPAAMPTTYDWLNLLRPGLGSTLQKLQSQRKAP